MLPSTFDRTRQRARIRHSAVRVGALLTVGLLAGGAVFGTAAPAQAQPTEPTTIDGITYVFDPAGSEAGATATEYDGTQGSDVTIPPEVAINGQTLAVTAIGESAFAWDQEDGVRLTAVKIPDTVTSIGDWAFTSNELTELQLPATITRIGTSAFQSNKLKGLVLPDSATTIGSAAFSFNKLESVTLPSSLTTIDDVAFAFNDLTTVTIPETVTTIGRSAFATNRLKAISIPDSVISIKPQAFQMNNLTSVALGNSVTTIDTDAFAWNALDSVVIPASVATVGGNAFGQNDSTFYDRPWEGMNPDLLLATESTMRSVTFVGRAPSIVPTLDTTSYPALDTSSEFTHASWGSFGAGYELTVKYPLAFQSDDESNGFTPGTWQGYASKNVETTKRDGVIYQYDPTEPFDGATATGYVKSHGSQATIASNVAFTPDGATIPVKSIGDAAFKEKGLTGLSVPDGITSIGDYAFATNHLTTLSLPESVDTIGVMAFGLNELTSVVLPSTLTEINMYAFGQNHLTTIDIPDTVIRIGDAAFAYNDLKSVTIPDSVVTIEPQAFLNNTLTSLTLGSSVESIGLGAFIWNALESVVIPAAVQTMQGMAFGENNTYFLTRPLPSDWDPRVLKDENSTLRSVTFAGRPPATFVPTTGPNADSSPDLSYDVMGSLGSGTGLTVHYPLAFESADPSTGFTAATWQGYTSAAFIVVSFEMGGHGDQPALQRLTPGKPATMPVTTPTAPGFTFTGWFTDAAATKAFNFNTPLTGDTVLFASWTKNPTTASVSFAMNGHGKQIASQTVTIGKLVTTPKAPTATGYTFTGWFTDAKATKKFSFSTKITGKTTLYAGWKVATASVSFAMNGHGKQIASQTVTIGKLVTTPKAPTATGYTFTGWFTDAKATKKFSFSTKITGKTTLYAGWKVATASVSFAMNGHGKQIASQTVTIGKLVTTPKAPTATGYTFTGWFTDAKATKKFSFSTKITGKTTLYAGWKVATASVSFAMNGHGKQIASQTVTIGKLVTTPKAPTATGYTFTGWFTDAKATKKFSFSTKITGKTTLYAGWKKKPAAR